ncbi:hypothetical protein KVT40_006868 [Elsinoe batatas]|uniref:Uncharacterized protein n=1 Tax=Elsinoe batatas TaxID=2601811 RepID=A0A8K0KXF4_9PEZI|nr:hypothetical protein KVT40_006868 [Elsinoe batatas]
MCWISRSTPVRPLLTCAQLRPAASEKRRNQVKLRICANAHEVRVGRPPLYIRSDKAKVAKPLRNRVTASSLIFLLIQKDETVSRHRHSGVQRATTRATRVTKRTAIIFVV